MQRLFGFVYLCSLARTIWTKPLVPAPDPGLLSQLNASSPNAPPPDFKVEITTDTEIIFDAEQFYRTAIKVMWDITNEPLDEPWLDRGWMFPSTYFEISLKHHPTGAKDPSLLTTRHLIWGLSHVVLSMTVSHSFCASVATLKWRGVLLGSISVSKVQPTDAVTKHTDTRELAKLGSDDNDRYAVSVYASYNREIPIDRNIVLFTSIKAIGEAAEKGFDTPLVSITTLGLRQIFWKLIGGSGLSQGVLLAGYSRNAVVQVVSQMLASQSFYKAYVWVKKEELSIAVGGFTRGAI